MSGASFSTYPSATPSIKSDHTVNSNDRFRDIAEFTEDLEDMDLEQEDAVHYCLLAEFDIDAGATLAYQYPYPTGTDEQYVLLYISRLFTGLTET